MKYSKLQKRKLKEAQHAMRNERQSKWHFKFVWWPTRAHEHSKTIIWMETVTRRRTNGLHDTRGEYVYGPVSNMLVDFNASVVFP